MGIRHLPGIWAGILFITLLVIAAGLALEWWSEGSRFALFLKTTGIYTLLLVTMFPVVIWQYKETTNDDKKIDRILNKYSTPDNR